MTSEKQGRVQARNWRVTPGARHRLGESTATCDWCFDGETTLSPEMLQRIRRGIETLWPAEPWPGVSPDDWPFAFVRTGAPRDHFVTWALALTVAIQRLARDPVGVGQVVEQQGSCTLVALPCQREDVLRGAMQLAMRHMLLWMQTDDSMADEAGSLRQNLTEWLTAAQRGGVPPNTLRFALAARARDIPVALRQGILHLGWGSRAERMDSSFTDRTSNIAARLARDKHQTSKALHAAGVPVPPTTLVSDEERALAVARKLGWPVVVKPSNQDQGAGVVTGIRDEDSLREAFAAAAVYSRGAVIVEKHIPGDDHRILVVGGKMMVATRRIPGGVCGDGLSTVAQLVDRVNADVRRGDTKHSLLIRLALDKEALSCLTECGLAVDAVPAAGLFVPLRRTANISTGGTAVDVTAEVHPDNRVLAERAARIIGLDIAGVDFLCPDISRSWREVGGAICEVNAQPGFRVHWLGDPDRDLNGEVVDWLFRDKPARIPTAAITGTNGKSTTARMLHHIWMTSGRLAGVCTTQGVWVGHDLVTDRNLSGYPGGRLLLADPAVEAAVLEMPRKGLIRFGHPCDRYDVAALLNVQDDHIGVDGIDSLEMMARLKAEVLARATQAVVINADDPLCLAMRPRAGAHRHILVARDERNPAVLAHRAQGGEAVLIGTYDLAPWVVLAEGPSQTRLMPLHDIPATMNGLLRFNETNALFAVALAWAQGLEREVIREALGTFHNSPEQNPGRYNFIEGLPFKVLLDYGHNPDGVRELLDVVSRVEVTGQRVLVSVVGNRFSSHLKEAIPGLASTFDRVYLAQNEAYFKRNAQGFGRDDPLGAMLQEADRLLRPLLGPQQALQLMRSDQQALREGLASCQSGDLLVLLAEPGDALPLLQAYRGHLGVLPH